MTSNLKASDQPTQWEKIFVSHVPVKRLIFNRWRTLQLNSNNNNDSIKNEQMIWIDIFSKENIQMTNRYEKKDAQHHLS